MYNNIICTNLCSSEAFCYNPGIKGKYYDTSRILLVLHRSDSRAIKKSIDNEIGLFSADEMQQEDPYRKALRLSDTGRLLHWLVYYCGITEDDLYITNLFKCVLPKDREPKDKEYRACTEVLRTQISDINPRKIIVFGRKPFEYMFPEISKTQKFKPLRQELYGNIPAIIIYHPRRIHDLKIGDRQKYFIEIRNFLRE
jgi:uracil-DNA glycosylase family 4